MTSPNSMHETGLKASALGQPRRMPWAYMCPPVLNPSHLPAHPILLSCPSTPAVNALFHASNFDWSSISHMVIYMFQCYSLKSSHPRLLPQSPKVCSLYLCLFCCLTYRVIITLSKSHIYALIYCIGVFLSDLLHSVP